MNEMLIAKEEPLYKYVKGMFTLINKDNQSTVFISDDAIYCKTKNICYQLKADIYGNSIFNELDQEQEYELSKLPGDTYRLKAIGFNHEKEKTYNAIIECCVKEKGICFIDAGEFGAVSKISINSRYCMSDSYAKSVEKFGECGVYLNSTGNYIILSKAEQKNEIIFRIAKAYYSISLDDIEAEKRANSN
ncbi:hypothetical protein [Coprobacillus sp. AF33-1AC]|uniref:hypothetical protein n=1 Tax=Coprobacillus sp. AF33-1AC TaxID=2292032 RepID=UPI000E4D5C12|nr:hypothetical protein [Coprobacillus sp. AF33-1AC]RHM59674.1 hypothetical protein DWZ53_09010 [Coprobacillus sp. AF33-1AC]